MMKLLYCLYICALMALIQAKSYTLRTDSQWPTAAQITALRSSLTGKLVSDTDSDYKAPSAYNLRSGPPQPGFLAKVANEDDIVKCLAFASSYNIRVSVRSTGHHLDERNSADQSIQLDLSLLNQNSINVNAKTVTVGPGQGFGEIHKYVKAQSGGTLVAVTGAEPAVGPAGWSMGGGHGRLTRLYGLGVDNLLSVNIVLANGTKTQVSETLYPELFRALRGSGGHPYGIVTSLTFRLYNDPGVVTQFAGYWLALDTVANAFQDWMKTAPNNALAYYQTGYDSANSWNYVGISALCFGAFVDCNKTMAPLAAIPGCGAASCNSQKTYNSYTEFLSATWDTRDHGGFAGYYVSGALDLSKTGQVAAVTAFQNSYTPSDWSGASVSCIGNAVLGGVSAGLDPNGTTTSVSSAMRSSLIAVTCGVFWAQGKSNPTLVQKMDNFADATLKSISTLQWVYWGEPQHNIANNDWQTRYWGGASNYAKLRAVKQQYDPNHILTCYHCVGWEDITNVDPASCPDYCSCSNAKQADTCVKYVGSSSAITYSWMNCIIVLLVLFFAL